MTLDKDKRDPLENEIDEKIIIEEEIIGEDDLEEIIIEEEQEIIEDKIDSEEPEIIGITDDITMEDVDELMDKYDLDTSKLRKLSGKVGLIVSIIAIIMSAFHLWTAWQGTLLAMKQRSLHMILAFTIGFLLYPAHSKEDKTKVNLLDWVFVALSIAVWGYIFFNVEAIALKGGRMSQQDLILGAIAILITLEVTRRVVGPELPIVTIVFLLYARFGRNMPGILAHRGFGIQRIVSHMYMTTEGIMG
ncbi:MAG: hypothetical protein QMB54_06175, partial [Neofamilia sp.]